MNVLFAGLIVWITTCILVTSELTAPIRDWFESKRDDADVAWISTGFSYGSAQEKHLQRFYTFWDKVSYLVNCTLCAGTWIGLFVALVVPNIRPFGSGVIGWLLAGLLLKAIAHGLYVFQRLLEELANAAGRL